MGRIGKNNGFSLIELMVVISIISMLAAMGLPKIQGFRIRAAQVEVYQITKTMASLAQSYHADNSIYPGLYSYGLIKYYPSVVADYCVANAVGFSTTNCAQLRYFYYFSTVNARLDFTITAQSYQNVVSGTMAFQYGGGGPPINILTCPQPSSGNYVYNDYWSLNQNGALSHLINAYDDCT